MVGGTVAGWKVPIRVFGYFMESYQRFKITKLGGGHEVCPISFSDALFLNQLRARDLTLVTLLDDRRCRSNKHLRVLNCAWNSLGGDDNADYWAFVIEDHPTLVDIDLSHNGLVDQNVFCILESMRVSGPVQRVNLVGNIARGLSGTSAQPFIRPPPPFLFTVTDDIDNDPITWDFCFAGRTKRRETVLNLHVPFERTVLRHM
jgi:hypothetical protein